MDKQFWLGKRVLLTGHTGFKGSWLSLVLQQLGAELTGFALNPPTNPNLFESARVAEGMHSIIGDIRHAELLKETIIKTKPEIIIHMAAQPLVRESYEKPLETYETNVMGVVHLFEAIRHCKSVRAVVNVTSDKCYENKEWLWAYREAEPMGGHDPYSSSKACAEIITSAYRKSFFSPEKYQEHGVALASARAGNVIGGGDWAKDRLIPDIMRAIQQGQSVKIRHPNAIRPWQHVLEPIHGYLNLAMKLYTDGLNYADAWNFGPSEEDAKSVQWIVQKMTSLWGEGSAWELDQAPSLHEANILKLDCSKAKSRLGWKPRWNLEKSLDNIVRWHKIHLQEQNMREFTLQQIASFSSCEVI